MESKVSEAEYKLILENIPNVLKETEQYLASIDNRESEINDESTSQISRDIFGAFSLSIATLIQLIKCKSEFIGNSNAKTSEKIILIASFVQGSQVSKELILDGQYIKASATLKQDFEFLTRLKGIDSGVNKSGVQPSVKNAPEGLRFIYGQVNDIAHISKVDILKFYVGVETNRGLGSTPMPQLKLPQASSFMLYLTAITFEILCEAIALHKELYGIDSCYKIARIHHKHLTQIFKKIENAGPPTFL